MADMYIPMPGKMQEAVRKMRQYTDWLIPTGIRPDQLNLADRARFQKLAATLREESKSSGHPIPADLLVYVKKS